MSFPSALNIRETWNTTCYSTKPTYISPMLCVVNMVTRCMNWSLGSQSGTTTNEWYITSTHSFSHHHQHPPAWRPRGSSPVVTQGGGCCRTVRYGGSGGWSSMGMGFSTQRSRYERGNRCGMKRQCSQCPIVAQRVAGGRGCYGRWHWWRFKVLEKEVWHPIQEGRRRRPSGAWVLQGGCD
jgi:hypothetical protein